MSERKSTSALSCTAPGDMYAGLPMISPACVPHVPPCARHALSWRFHKSSIFTARHRAQPHQAPENKFSGFRSR